jgi:hypothetical protein
MLKDVNVNVKIKLAALWASVMFLYAYADITHFVLQPGSLEDILKGKSVVSRFHPPSYLVVQY